MWREADNSIINICTPICWYWESIPKAVFFLKNIQWDRVHRYIHSWPMSGKTTFTGILYITDLWGLKDTLTFMIFASVSKILKLNWNIECWQNQVLLMNSFYLKTYWDISFCQDFQIFSFFLLYSFPFCQIPENAPDFYYRSRFPCLVEWPKHLRFIPWAGVFWKKVMMHN